MSVIAPPLPRVLSVEKNAEPASNDVRFGPPVAPQAPATGSGWDPYEVWRTRIFDARPNGPDKARGRP